jgi:glucose/arabinose dehydrogenase
MPARSTRTWTVRFGALCTAIAISACSDGAGERTSPSGAGPAGTTSVSSGLPTGSGNRPGSTATAAASSTPACAFRQAPPADPPDPAVAPDVSLAPDAVGTIATRLCVPWALAFLPDGSALVTERGDLQGARILSVTADSTVAEVQRIPEARATGEGGLLGIAVSPHYADDQWVYIYYSTASDNRIARLHLGEDPEPILTGIPGGGDEFHNGGRLAFGPDGMLYATTGEAYYTREIAQDEANLGGKILRITPEGEPAPGNPFGDSPVYSYGHRNVQGIAWDADGRLFASELGEDHCDELNLITSGGNYGWPTVEGPAADSRFIDPIASWCPTALASPSGIAIVGDHVYVACLRGERLYRVSLDGRAVETMLDDAYGRLRSVTAAPDGSLWILTTNRDGRATHVGKDDDRLLRLVP